MVYKEFPDTVVGKPPRGFAPGRPYGRPIWVVWHTTEGSESLTAAEDGNAYDARRADLTSTHVFVDGNTVVQEVNSGDRAFAALSVANNRGYQVELCGKAAQTANQWSDGASSSMLLLACQHVARVCIKLNIPPRWLSEAEVRARQPGFITHKNVTDWLEGTHEDPGPNFPKAMVATQVAHYIDQYSHPAGVPAKPAPVPQGSERMKLIQVSGQPAIYKTDGFTYRRVEDMVALADLQSVFGAVVKVKQLKSFGTDTTPVVPVTGKDATAAGTTERDHTVGPQ